MTVRVRSNSITGVIQEAPLGNAATALAMAGRMQNLATVGTGQVAVLVIDPEGTDVLAGSGTEIVYVTAYTSGGGSATISRGQEGTTGRPHSAGTRIVHSPTKLDFGGSLNGFDTGGVFRVGADDSYLGSYANGMGTGVSRLHINTDSGAAYLLAEGDGADRNLAFRKKGSGGFFFQTAVGGTLAEIDTGGGIAAIGNTHYFGAYALGTGTGVSRLGIGPVATGVVLTAEGDGSNRDFALRFKGTGTVFFQDESGVTKAQISSAGAVSALGADHYLGTYALGAGTGVSRLHVSSASATLMKLKGESDAATCSVSVEASGASGFFTVDQDGGGTFFGVRPNTDNGDTYSRVLITFNESAVENTYYVRVGPAGSGPGGSGKALYV